MVFFKNLLKKNMSKQTRLHLNYIYFGNSNRSHSCKSQLFQRVNEFIFLRSVMLQIYVTIYIEHIEEPKHDDVVGSKNIIE